MAPLSRDSGCNIKLESVHGKSLLEASEKEKHLFPLATFNRFTQTDCMRILGSIGLLAMLASGALAAERQAAATSRGAPKKIIISDEARSSLESSAAELGREIENLRIAPSGR